MLVLADSVYEALREIFGVFGPCRVSQSDNGTEFKAGVEILMKENQVQFRHGAVRKPQTQGLVERG